MDVTFYLFFMAFLVSLSAWCIFLWAVRTGQFRDVEDIKYQIWPKTTAAGHDTGEPAASPPSRML